ncbi:MAG TPA: glycosyltransferase family 39 protein [Anaerolineales bacterium]|nr:glycosyltransferase family 39 protein [Anaerolineales bacterium]
MADVIVDRKPNIWDKVHSHLEILSIREKDIRFFLSSPYRIGLILLFTVLFLPHAFIMVEDISLVRAFEMDPGSIVASIESLYHRDSFYNMNAPYHPRFYGWAYYWINFILAAPGYFLMRLGVLEGPGLFVVLIRLILFGIGLAFVLAYFEVARRVLKHNLLALVACLLCMASPVVSYFFYFIHPETTGLLFLFLALLCLLKFNEGSARDSRWYTFALLFLTLSVLSKHPFALAALPVLFLFLYVYCYYHNISVFRFMLSKQFWRVLLGSLILSVLIFFIINPFAFLQPRTFLSNQIYLFSGHSQGVLSEAEAIKKWLDILRDMPIIWISLLLAPLSLLGASLFGDQKVNKIMYITNLLGAVFFTFFNVMSIRYIIYNGYLAPIYPFFILNILGVALFIVRKWNMGLQKLITLSVLTIFLSFVFIKDTSVSLPLQWNRLRYQDSLAYQSYKYIEANIPDGKRIAHDHFVAVPHQRDLKGCHYSSEGCGTDYIEEFRPHYIIFDPNWTSADVGVLQRLRARMIKYIDDHDFVLIDTIGPYNGSYLQVWKKPRDSNK